MEFYLVQIENKGVDKKRFLRVMSGSSLNYIRQEAKKMFA